MSAATVSVLGVAPGQVARVTVTITGEALAAPIAQDLLQTATGWAGTVSPIPAGTGFTFTAEAFGAGSPGPVLYRGTAAPVTIVAEQIASVTITLLEANPTPGPVSKVPAIAGLGASATQAGLGTVVHVSVTAYSPEGHPLGYLWQSACGTFADPTRAATDWTAGATGGRCPLSIRVSDAANATAVTAYLVIDVEAPGGAGVDVQVNTYPLVMITAEEHIVASSDDVSGWPFGITADLVAMGSDPDGEAVTYEWTSSCDGYFDPSDYGPAEVRFFVPEPAAVCVISVQVSDARGGVTTASVVLSHLAPRMSTVQTGAIDSFTIDTGGALRAWGYNMHGELGDGTNRDRFVPGILDFGFASVAGGWEHTVAVKTDGTLWAWGSNERGQLGDGTTISRLSPVQVGSQFVSVAAGTGFTVGIKTDGTLWAWGRGGLLGDGTSIDRHAPVLVGSGFASVATGSFHTVALQTDGTLWAWGNNLNGELGDGTTIDRHIPVRIGSGYASVSAGHEHTVAIKKDGTLWTWGYNSAGQLGDGTTTSRPEPMQIGSGFAHVDAGLEYTAGVRTDGTLWVWGFNHNGQVGDGTTVDRHMPVQVGSGFAAVAAGDAHTLALKTDGSVWAWGSNEWGQLGDGTTVERHAPTLIVFPP